MALKLKTVTVENKVYAEIVDGKPVYVNDEDNKDMPMDVPSMYGKIIEDGKRNSTLAKENKELGEKLKMFDGLDAEAARKALDTVKNIEEGQLIAAGKVEEIKSAANRAAEERIAAASKASSEKIQSLEAEAKKLQDTLHNEKIGGSFSRSKFITDKMSIPPDLVQSRFGANFKFEDGKVVGYDSAGNKLYSRAKPGEMADFEEAIEMLVDSYPMRDHILKGQGGGSGARNANGGGSGNKTMTRMEFDALDHATKAQRMRDGYKVAD